MDKLEQEVNIMNTPRKGYKDEHGEDVDYNHTVPHPSLELVNDL